MREACHTAAVKEVAAQLFQHPKLTVEIPANMRQYTQHQALVRFLAVTLVQDVAAMMEGSETEKAMIGANPYLQEKSFPDGE